MSLLTTLILLAVTYYLIGSAGVIAIGSIVLGPKIWQKVKSNPEENLKEIFNNTENEGGLEMLPQDIWDKIGKIIEGKTGVKFSAPKSIEEILSKMPPSERAKIQPILVPILVDALREATGMDMDASIRLRKYLLGQGIGLTELDISVETDSIKMEKTLAGLKRFKEIANHYCDELEVDPVTDFVKNMFTFKLLTEAFKDMQLPPGWNPQRVAGLLSSGPSGNNTGEPLVGEIVDD